MKNTSRLIFAAVLVGLLVVVATGVWAAPNFQSTVPQPPRDGNNETEVDRRGGDGAVGGAAGAEGGAQCEDPTLGVDMGTAVFSPGGNSNCGLEVVKVEDPAKDAGAAPQGKAFMGDVFKMSTDNEDVTICFAYPPEASAKNAKIHKFNAPDWVEVPDAEIADGKICVNSNAQGFYALIGDE